ncbi:uncharacterized protein ACIBXB_000020 [Morphnus guianensis]
MERPRWGNRCTGGGGGGEKKKKRNQHIYSARGENVRRLLKGAGCPRRGSGARAGREPGPAAGRRLCPGNALPGPAAGPRGDPARVLTCSSRDARRAGVGAAAKTKGAAGAGAAAGPGRSERRRGGLEPRGGAGAAARGVRARPAACACPAARVGLGRRVGELAPVFRAPGSLPGCKFLVSGFWEPVGTGASLAKQEEGAAPPVPPSLSLSPPSPRCICPGSRRGGGEGARGQRAGGGSPARPPLAARPAAFVRGSGGSASRGGWRSCSRGEGEWQSVKRHFRNVNIKIGAIQPRFYSPRAARDSAPSWLASGEGVRQPKAGGGSCYYNRVFGL